MNGQVSVVTGANSGIGFETSHLLAEQGASVVMVCRDRGRGEAAMTRIRGKVPNADLKLEVRDLAVLDEVRRI